MRTAVLVFLFASFDMAQVSAVVFSKDVWWARDKGAEFDVPLRVVDDRGRPVRGARCCGWMYVERHREHGCGYAEQTDANGNVRITGKCSEWFSVVVRKEGYYKTMFDMKYPVSNADPPIVDGKWQPYGETRTVVLKKINEPAPLLMAQGKYLKIPAFGMWLGYDLEKGDWVPPYGRGIMSDMRVRFTTLTDRGSDLHRIMEVSFTSNPFAGAYVMKRDEYSEFDTVYRADSNACFRSTFRYEFIHMNRKIVRDELRNDQYMVFRIRTEVDDDGHLKSAHYGKLLGNWKFFERNNMRIGDVVLNPVANDPNLEDVETARRSRLGYRQSLEFERLRKAREK